MKYAAPAGGDWKAQVPLRDGYKFLFLGVYDRNDNVVYACDRMKGCAGVGIRHRPVHWQTRCQNRFCSHGAPVVLQGEDITKLPGFKGFDRRSASFEQSYDVYWKYRTGHDKDNLTHTLPAYCPGCRAEIERQDAERRRFGEACRLCREGIPCRPALRFQDVVPECRQVFKKSLGGRRSRKKAENGFYAHIRYRDGLLEKRVEEVTAALERVKRDKGCNTEIRSMQYEFRRDSAGEGLFLHTLFIEFPSVHSSFSITI